MRRVSKLMLAGVAAGAVAIPVPAAAQPAAGSSAQQA